MAASSNGGRSGRRMILRRDHIAGGVFIAAGAIVFALSGELPFGTLASPGAGMMPKLALLFLIGFGVILAFRAGDSPPISAIDWGDLSHAATVTAVAAVAIAAYTTFGFVLSVSVLLFVLIYFIERRSIWRAAAVSIGITVAAYILFSTLLKSPLPPFSLGF